MSYDYLETVDDAALQKAKNDFGDFVISIENRLDQAEAFGEAGDMRMLTTLLELQDVQNDLVPLAHNANEELPSKNYHVEVTKLIRAYIVGIIQKEYETIQQLIQDSPQLHQEFVSRINQLLNVISFYHQLYPELDLNSWEEKVQSLA
jgi:hypothetical protein